MWYQVIGYLWSNMQVTNTFQLFCSYPVPAQLLPLSSFRSCPAPALLMLLPSSFPAPAPSPAPALLLPTWSCPTAQFLLLPCSCPASALPGPGLGPALLLSSSIIIISTLQLFSARREPPFMVGLTSENEPWFLEYYFHNCCPKSCLE